MKKIGLLIPNLGHGGAERSIIRLYHILNNSKKYKVKLITFDSGLKSYEFNGEIINMNEPSKKNVIGKFFTFIKRVYTLKKIKKQNKFDVVISFLDSANIVNLLTSNNEKRIVSIRNYKKLENKGIYELLYNLAIKLFYNLSDHVVVVSELIKSDLMDRQQISEKKIKVIYNSYDLNEIKNKSEEIIQDDIIKLKKKNKIIISVGRLTEQKGFWNLLKVFKLINDSDKNTILIIIGTGELEESLKKLSKEYGIDENVIFMGHQTNPFPYLKIADLYLLTSLYEGFPNAMVEAMCCGVPVISVNCKSGPSEILNGDISNNNDIQFAEYGIIVPEFSSKVDFLLQHDKEHYKMASAAIQMLGDNKLLSEYSKQSCKRANMFSYQVALRHWERVI